jgi:hypothetical protein
MLATRLRLRDFFGGGVDPSQLIGILAVRPDRGFIDDIDYFVTDEAEAPSPNQFVQFRLQERGFKLIDHGRFRSNNQHHEQLRLHIAYGPFLKPRVSDPVCGNSIVCEVIRWLLEDGLEGRPKTDERLSEDRSRIFRAIIMFVQRYNGHGFVGLDNLTRLEPYLDCCNMNEWYVRIRDALDSCSDCFPSGGPDANSCAWYEPFDQEEGTGPGTVAGSEPGTESDTEDWY